MAQDDPKTSGDQPAIPLVDDPGAPVFYVDWVAGGGVALGGSFNMTFVRQQYDYSEGGVRAYQQVVMRMVIPIAGLQQASEFISAQLAKASGQSPPPAPPVPKAKLN